MKMNEEEVQRNLIYLTSKTNHTDVLLAIEIARKCVSAVYHINKAMEVMDCDNEE